MYAWNCLEKHHRSIEDKYASFLRRKGVGMTQSKSDLPSLLMVLSFMANVVIYLFDPIEIQVPKEIGLVLFVCGFLIFFYVILYLRSGFFGDTKPKLDFLIMKGPYRFCRHPQYLSFIIIIFGLDLMFGSVMGIALTLVLSIPSVVYRGRIEDRLLRNKFGDEWENYADEVGFLFPKLHKKKQVMWR